MGKGSRLFGMVVAVGLASTATPTQAQEAAGAKAQPVTFAYEVSLIKPDKSGSNGSRMSFDIDHLKATNVPLKMLIRMAWNLNTEELISGVPGWANSARFDIEAKLDAETAAALKKLPFEERKKQDALMMQALLVDRFQLKVHHETKELPIYALVIAKGGAKLKDADPNGPNGHSLNTNNQNLTATEISMADLAEYFSQRLRRMVEDRTGLSGTYDFTLQWSRDEDAGDAASAAPSPFPTLFTAIQEQLGLRLESAKGPVDTIVVDRIEQPSEN